MSERFAEVWEEICDRCRRIPPIVTRNPRTGRAIRKEYYVPVSIDKTDYSQSRPPGSHYNPRTDDLSGHYYTTELPRTGVLHRAGGRKPAVIDYDPNTGEVTHEEYWNRGRLGGRFGKPAVIERDLATGTVIYEAYRGRDGTLHRRGSKPAVIERDPATGTVIYEKYWNHGIFHRGGDKPAIIKRDPTTSVVTYEEYPDGSKIVRDPVTGTVIYEEYYKKGLRHRGGDKPAVINRDPVTDVATHEEYYEKGILHRAGDKPAVIKRDPATGAVIYEEYYEKGIRHRDGDKPAVIKTTGNVTIVEYWNHGIPQRKPTPADYRNAADETSKWRKFWPLAILVPLALVEVWLGNKINNTSPDQAGTQGTKPTGTVAPAQVDLSAQKVTVLDRRAMPVKGAYDACPVGPEDKVPMVVQVQPGEGKQPRTLALLENSNGGKSLQVTVGGTAPKSTLYDLSHVPPGQVGAVKQDLAALTSAIVNCAAPPTGIQPPGNLETVISVTVPGGMRVVTESYGEAIRDVLTVKHSLLQPSQPPSPGGSKGRGQAHQGKGSIPAPH